MNKNSTASETTYRIGELARLAGVTPRTIRYYEELGLLRQYERRDTEHRRFTDRDLLYLRRIQQLKSYDLTLHEIIEIFDLSIEDPTGEKRKHKLLERYKEKLYEAAQRKAKIEEYIQELEWHIDQLEDVIDFQSCPGSECEICKYADRCNFSGEARLFRHNSI